MILKLSHLRIDYKSNRKHNPPVAERLLALVELTKVKMRYNSCSNQAGKRMKISALLTSIDISQRTIQRWEKSYRDLGAMGLGKKKISGKIPEDLSDKIQEIITSYRKLYRWGSEVIQAHLKFDHGHTITRFKIERYLDISGLREQYPCTTRKRKVKKKKKHTSVVKVYHPGLHTQMDVKYQIHLLVNKSKCYVYNFIDHSSNWSFKHSYPAINAKNTKDFMNRLIIECPFDIFRLQTDNGVEFTFKYVSVSDEPKEHPLDEFCDVHGIVHKLIPPGEKELQGLVERSHRQDDQELFFRIDPEHLDEFNKELTQYWKRRNQNRRFKKLGWLTPNEWLEQYLVVSIATKLLSNPQQKGLRPFSRGPSEQVDVGRSTGLNEDGGAQTSNKEINKNDEKYGKLAA